MAAVPKRIEKETQKLSQEPRMSLLSHPIIHSSAPGIVANPDADNYRYFHVQMEGPGGTPYEGMYFFSKLIIIRWLVLLGTFPPRSISDGASKGPILD